MTRDPKAEEKDNGPGPDGIPESDPRYEETDPGEFEKVTRDNLTSDESLIVDPEDSEEHDR